MTTHIILNPAEYVLAIDSATDNFMIGSSHQVEPRYTYADSKPARNTKAYYLLKKTAYRVATGKVWVRGVGALAIDVGDEVVVPSISYSADSTDWTADTTSFTVDKAA